MYENYNKTRKKVTEYEKPGLQTRGGYTAYDKGESSLPTMGNQTKAPTPPFRKNNNYSGGSQFEFGAIAKNSLKSALQPKKQDQD